MNGLVSFPCKYSSILSNTTIPDTINTYAERIYIELLINTYAIRRFSIYYSNCITDLYVYVHFFRNITTSLFKIQSRFHVLHTRWQGLPIAYIVGYVDPVIAINFRLGCSNRYTFHHIYIYVWWKSWPSFLRKELQLCSN